MVSRYDYMRTSNVEDIDGEQYPDPLTIDYQSVVEHTTGVPRSFTLSLPDLKKLWVKHYKETNRTEMDDVLYSVNGIEHVGVLEPEDTITLYDVYDVRQFAFKDLT